MNSYTINSTFRTFNNTHKISMPKIRHQTYNLSNNSLSESKNQSKPHIHFKQKSGMLNNIIQKIKNKKLLSPSRVHNSSLRLKKKQKKTEKKVHYLTDNEQKTKKNKNENENNNNNNNNNNNEMKKNSKALSSKKLEININNQLTKQNSNLLSQLSKISENSSNNNLNGTNLDTSFCKSTVDRKEIISNFFLKDTRYNNLNDSLNGTDYEKSSSDIISFRSMQKINKKMKFYFCQKKKKKEKIGTKRENFDFENDIYDKINFINNKRNSIKEIYFNKIKNIIDYYKINKENNVKNNFEKQIFQTNKNFKPSDFKTDENIYKYTKKFKKPYINLNILNSHFKTLNKYYIENCILEQYFNVQLSKIIFLFNFISSNNLDNGNLLENFSIKKPHFKRSHNGKMNNLFGLNINLKIFPGFDLIFLSNFHRKDFEYDIDINLQFNKEERTSLSKRRVSVIFSCLKSSKSGIKFTNRATWKYLIKKNNRFKNEERDEKSSLLKKSLLRNSFYSRNTKTNLRAER